MAIGMQSAEKESAVQDAANFLNFENVHKVIGAFVDVLQNCFKRDTRYPRPLLQPQANIVFAIDDEMAHKMTTYMCGKLVEVGFEKNEFRFCCKSSVNGEMVKHLRLEFHEGVSREIVWKMIRATGVMQQYLNHSKVF